MVADGIDRALPLSIAQCCSEGRIARSTFLEATETSATGDKAHGMLVQLLFL